jgi:hypothetical protein
MYNLRSLPNESKLMERLMIGDREALLEIVDLYFEGINLLALLLLSVQFKGHALLDIARRVSVKAFRRLMDNRDHLDPSKGIKSILINHMLDLIEETQSDITS